MEMICGECSSDNEPYLHSLYKSSKTCMWPVLCAVMLDPVTIFPTALTSSLSRPTDLGFLEDTVRELAHLMNHGIHSVSPPHRHGAEFSH